MQFTKKHIEKLLQEGKIRGYTVVNEKPKLPPEAVNKKPKALIWLDLNLEYWAKEHSVTMVREFKFHEERLWRFDYAFPDRKWAVEYEGIFKGSKSGHTTMGGFKKDTEKYNAAAALGWTVFRVTADNCKKILELLNGMYAGSH